MVKAPKPVTEEVEGIEHTIQLNGSAWRIAGDF